MQISSTELGQWLMIAGLVVGAIASIVLAVVWFIKTFVTRFEFNKLTTAVDELKKISGKLSPEAEEQMMKVLRKLLDYVEAKERRDANERRK